MKLAVTASRALTGMDAPPVEIETHMTRTHLPSFNIVGLPDTEVKESRDRVRAAILQSGFDFPAYRITVNLAPAELPKESGRFDLPIAVGILAASGQVDASRLAEYEFAGELALSGLLRPVRGALLMVRQAAGRSFILPEESALQAARAKNTAVYGAASLADVAAHLNGAALLPRAAAPENDSGDDFAGIADLADVKGQQNARYALELAAAGGHSLLMMGPPGTGKSMLAQRLPGIMPPLTAEEILDNAALFSLISPHAAAHPQRRPFRSPHHSASAVALVGGGSDPRPGEISLANHGVLFLDELPEFDRKVLEVLREPLESGEIHISRAAHSAVFPAHFQLVAAMNPCPCGYFGHPVRPCRCSADSVARYRQKISGPLLDRIDIVIDVPALSAADLLGQSAGGETSAAVRARVQAARARQYTRQGKTNAALTSADLEQKAEITDEAKNTLGALLEKLNLSARSFHRILRVARTIADLEGSEAAGKSHVLRAVGFRRSL